MSNRKILVLLFLLGVALRLVTRLGTGEADFVATGYYFFQEISQNFLNGGGFCLPPGIACAMRMPLYPLFLTPFVASQIFFYGVVITQSVIGAALVWVTAKLGEELFDARTGLLAAGLVAFNPYSVIHDTALQETAVFNFLIGLATLFLFRMSRPRGQMTALAAGACLALATLTTARIALFIPFAVLWTSVAGDIPNTQRARRFALFVLPLTIFVGGWMVRNWRLVGAPVLTTEVGVSLWEANNEWTFSNFPVRSMDQSKVEALRHLTLEQLNELEQQKSDVPSDRVLYRWGAEYIKAHPFRSVWYAVRKISIAASGQLSPSRGSLRQIGYGIFFGCVHLLAAAGLWNSRNRWKLQLPIYFLFVSFFLTTAVFWAHTSHKSYLDPFLFIYAASVVMRLSDVLHNGNEHDRADISNNSFCA